MNKLSGLLFVFYMLLLQACNMINPKETIPTFIQIDSVHLAPTVLSKHGSISHKITDVWVYYDLQFLGAFELPAKVPVITEGRGQLQIVAGIWDNGLSGTRAKYPFYTVDTFTFSASPAQTLFHTPQFNYRTTDTPAITYTVEDFEQGNGFTKYSGDTSLVRTNTSGELFEGDWSGKITLDSAATSSQIITIENYSLPANQDAYLEMNYKCDVPISMQTRINYQGAWTTYDIIGLKARDNWTKVYLKLSGFSATYQNGKFRFIIASSLPSGMDKATVLIDNFKIIYFN
ncbi:MAG TPA: hypothetical protein PLU10_06200 [Chitinophagaceae bacterium]|nr:hypothetical protein [Chitinophagaceae bacterium]